MVPRDTFLKAVLLACFLAAPAAAGDFEDMVAAERAFAADASARSTRDAFIAALADDGVVFAPGPVNGKHVWGARPANKNRLEWAPELAEIAASGDLGYTAGPWRFTQDGAEKPTAFGHFFTIWQKQADGKWKFLIDHGISHGEAAFPETVVRRGGISVGAAPSWPVGMGELRQADLLAPGELNARLVSADFLRLREGRKPDGQAQGEAMAATGPRLDSGAVISEAGDLAATWGGGDDSPAWIRVWRRPSAEDAPGKGWQLAVDLSLPAAVPAP